MAPSEPDPDQVRQRADELLPEEKAAGVDDPEGLAEAVLEDSEARIDQRGPEVDAAEHRHSEDTVNPVEDNDP